MSGAEIERRAVEKAYALRDALVAARRFWAYGRYADDTRRVSAGVIGALHGAGRFFVIMLEEVARRLVGPPAVVFGGGWGVERKEEVMLLVRAAATTEGYERFAEAYGDCVREQAQLDVMQARWENAQLYFAWTTADREDIGVLFGELRRLWAAVLAQVNEIKSLLDVLMQMQVERRRLTSKLTLPKPRPQHRPKPPAGGKGVQELLDALARKTQ
jgi:hypothetical protein